jgi:hypothetical protein
MSSSDLSPTDLTVEEVFALEQVHLIAPSTTINKRKVSAAFLTPPSTDSSSLSSASGSTASVRFHSFSSLSPEAKFDFPQSVNSVATLEFIGFETQTALTIYNRWTHRSNPADNPNEIIDFAYGHINQLKSPQLAELSPTAAMQRVGINQQICNAIMNPRFTDIFLTDTLHFWVKDTMHINWSTLLSRKRQLKKGAATTMAKGKVNKRAKIGDLFPEILTPTLTLSTTLEDFHLPQNHVAVSAAGPILPDHVVLYKGKAADEMFSTNFIREDGSINIIALQSHTGGDFNHVNPAYYFSTQRDVAEQYRAWAEERNPTSTTWIIRVQIPQAFVSSLTQGQLYYSFDWKQFVWYCKCTEQPPDRYKHLWHPEEGVDLIIGHCSKGTQNIIAKIHKDQVQTNITEDNLVMSSDGKAIQYVFMKASSATRLALEMRGKVHIDITAPAIPQSK